MKERKVEMLPISLIRADENQPRKNFAPERIADLVKSIKQHGIMNPLIVERRDSGSYVLVDGERRYRAAKELRLKEVPAIVMAPQSEVDRLIQQFHLQEQHEGWTAIEKAAAVVRLAEELKIGVAELAETLSLPPSTVSEYASFGKLHTRKDFQKNEISLKYAPKMIGLRTYVSRRYFEIGKEFPPEKEKALEEAVIARIKDGSIKRVNDLAKIRDAARTDPLSIDKFVKDSKISVDKLFIDTNAKSAFHFRNIINMSSTLGHHIREGLVMKVENHFDGRESDKSQVLSVYEELGKLIKKI